MLDLEEFNSQSRENISIRLYRLFRPSTSRARPTYLFAAFNGNTVHYANDFSSPHPPAPRIHETRVKYDRGRGMQSPMTRLPAEILPNHQVVRRATAPGTAQFARVFVVVSLIVSRLITAFICARSHAQARTPVAAFRRRSVIVYHVPRRDFITRGRPIMTLNVR